MGTIDKRLLLAVLLVILLFAIVVGLPSTYAQRVALAIQVLFVGLLTVVTAYYADKTEEISKATQAQAVATVASVSEMVKQRYLSTQPWVFPALFLEQETSGLGGALYEEAPPSLVSFRNLGNGVAMEVRISISAENASPTKDRIREIQQAWKQRTLVVTQQSNSHSWPIVDRGQRVLWVNAFESPREDTPPGIILVEYQDIYGTEFLSGWAYRFARVQSGRLALIPGEPLYPVSRS